MKSLNRSHIKFRNTQKRANKLPSRPPQKMSSSNENTASKDSRKKKSANPVPTPRISVGSLATSRETLILNVATSTNNSFTTNGPFLDKKGYPTIKIEDEYAAEEHSCDPKMYIKSTTHRTNGKQFEIAKKMNQYKVKIAKLEKENLNLKKSLNAKESELKKRNTTKEKKAGKKIKEKLLNFAKSFNKALEMVESMCTVCAEVPNKITKRSESLRSKSSTSSLVTIVDFAANTPLEITSHFPSKINTNSKSTEIAKLDLPVQNVKKKGKTTFRNIKTKDSYKKK